MTRDKVWPPPPDRFTIMRTDPQDQPPVHDPAKPWAIIHPSGIEGGSRRITRRATQPEALAFVLAQPEVIRRNRRK